MKGFHKMSRSSQFQSNSRVEQPARWKPHKMYMLSAQILFPKSQNYHFSSHHTYLFLEGILLMTETWEAPEKWYSGSIRGANAHPTMGLYCILLIFSMRKYFPLNLLVPLVVNISLWV